MNGFEIDLSAKDVQRIKKELCEIIIKHNITEYMEFNLYVQYYLEADYFEKDDFTVRLLKKNSGGIAQIRTKDVGTLMRMNHKTVEEGLKQGVFPWGYAIKTSDNHHRYFVNAQKFAEIEGVQVPPEMVV